MLFNSPEFIFLFLPIALLFFFLLSQRTNSRWALVWLVSASLFFYSWWNPPYLALLIFSILFNYFMGSALGDRFTLALNKKLLLIGGISVNLALIGYYKYTNFIIFTVNDLFDKDLEIQKIILPLGISFFTFQQISYLVDAYRGETKEYNFLNYCLFVTFFPQLIAGPIVHHKEVMPQFANKYLYRFSQEDMAVGLTIFSIGLFKKVIFADTIAIYASPVFNAAAQGVTVTFFEAWGAAVAYSLQLYFDFSGYSDMAIGAARMFGVKLPLNFNSPYKSANIIDFWRRWHMTLSRFLRDYVYITLGGNRKGKFRRYINLMVTMLLGGLWHGAGWTFVFWGGLHGIYLIINNQWHAFRRSRGHDLQQSHWWSRILGGFVTFIAVLIAWVFFRAASMEAAIDMLEGMMGMNGISIPVDIAAQLGPIQSWLANLGMTFRATSATEFILTYILSAILLAIAWFTPNTQQWMERYNPALDYDNEEPPSTWTHYLLRKFHWKPSPAFALIISTLIFMSCKTLLTARPSEFLYFNF